MAQKEYRTLTKRIVDRLSVNGKDAIFWDSDLPSFGVRVYPSGKKVFIVQTRAFGRSKRVSLGAHGDVRFTVDDARKKAGEVIGRIQMGERPVPPKAAPDRTIADLAERYQREYVEMHCKPATVSHYRIMLRKHIVPALGELLVEAVKHNDIVRIHSKLHDASRMRGKFHTARSLFRTLVYREPKYQQMRSSFDYVLEVCNAAIHGQRIAKGVANEAIGMGAANSARTQAGRRRIDVEEEEKRIAPRQIVGDRDPAGLCIS